MEFFNLILIIVIACLCLYTILYIWNKLFHFKRLKIPHEQQIPFLGNMAPFIFRRLSLAENIRGVYNLLPDVKYFGFYEFMTPVYVIRDPELIATIAIKNFDNFCDHNGLINTEFEPLVGKNLFTLEGDYWREMRKLLSPSFTSGKIKIMSKLISECAENIADFLATDSGNIGKTYDMKDVLSRCTNDVVATCAFGIKVDSFKDSNNEFFLFAKEIANFISVPVKLLINKNFPLLGKLLRLKMFSTKIKSPFREIIADTVKTRNEQVIIRPDMIHLMMETRDQNHSRALNLDEMTAQAFIFLFAGFDSTSSAMCFLTHEI